MATSYRLAMGDDPLQQRAVAEALKDPEARLARIRGTDRALRRHAARAGRRRKVAGVLGVLGLIGGGVLAVLGATAVLATPLAWGLAAGAAAAGLAGLASSGAGARLERRVKKRRKSMRLGHEGRVLAVEALLERLDAVRSATAGDYARYEERVLATVDPSRHAENAELLQSLRARQLEHVRRLDVIRERAVVLRARLVEAAGKAEAERKVEAVSAEHESYQDRLARNVFERADASDELERIELETDALEELEAEYVEMS